MHAGREAVCSLASLHSIHDLPFEAMTNCNKKNFIGIVIESTAISAHYIACYWVSDHMSLRWHLLATAPQLVYTNHASLGVLNVCMDAAGQQGREERPSPAAGHPRGKSQSGALSGVNLMLANAQSMRSKFYAESTVADSDSDWEE